MATCSQCGRESPDDFGFCPGCGATLAQASPQREVRKVVTVLFCDLTGSTAIGDRTDPEALRALMTRYYDAARGALERHGGTVEKFVGDAVMAVFGIPQSSEDDALRAVRAAVEVRDSVYRLGLEARIGVNTGEVVAGEGDTLVTGDAVNVAARLEQAAAPGEVLLGEETERLVRDAVETEAVELVLKGKSEPVAARRLLAIDVSAVGAARHLDRPLVGRERERERLRRDFEDAAASRTCRLFTLIGPAGVGKSRLVADFVEHVEGRATVARGRALSYGEGITYWPLVEILVQLGLDPDESIRSSPADTQLATRALLERVADEKPLVLVLDDLHWAEPPLLDLVEHLADWSREAPIFLLCVARPELLDLRPGWGGGKLNATSILLEPLPPGDAETLAAMLLGGSSVDEGTRERVLAAAEGNPLFIEELAALAQEAGGAAELPPTIHAVLQARLDLLDDRERAVVDRGAVEGRVFHRGAVTALTVRAQRDGVADHLLALVRKELVRPDRTRIPGDDAFRFRHLLIRDTAYEALPKATRAELHERFAAWLVEHGGLLELDEIVGYHLEQAARYRRELDPDDLQAAELATAAAARLGAAGRAALEREDLHATRNLLGRAVALLPEGPDRRGLLPELAEAAIAAGDVAAAVDVVGELDRGDERDRATAVTLRAIVDPESHGGRTYADLPAEVGRAQAVLEAAGDVVGVARCERARAHLAWIACRAGEAHRAWRRAHDLLAGAGSTAFWSDAADWVIVSAVFAGTRSDDVLRLLDDLEHEAEQAGPLASSSVRTARARVGYTAGLVDADAVSAAVDAHAELQRQTGSLVWAVQSVRFLELVAWLEGDDGLAELRAREHVDALDALGDAIWLPNVLAEWAIRLCRVGEPRRALDAVARGRALARDDDVADQIVLDLGEGYARAILGEAEAACTLVARAREAAAGLDMRIVSDEVDVVDADVRAILGDVAGAHEILSGLATDAVGRGLARFATRYRRDLEALA